MVEIVVMPLPDGANMALSTSWQNPETVQSKTQFNVLLDFVFRYALLSGKASNFIARMVTCVP